jgi:alkylation response protein AidB-like acyl-CoA dehydrogenase
MSANPQIDDDIRMIRDSAAAVAPPGGVLRRIRALRFHSPGYDPAIWHELCALGWPGLLLPDSIGGSGLGMRAYCALLEQLGAGLVPEPLIGATLAARLLDPSALADVLSGAQLVLPAWQEVANALKTGEGTTHTDGRVSGRKLFIQMAGGADAFIVTTQTDNVLVARDAPGLHLELAGTQDGGFFGTLTLQNTPGRVMPTADIAAALEEGTLATAAYLLGVMERAFAMTLDYLRTRKQFGRAIGSFQALQHRAADLQVQIALTRASVESAAAALDAGATGAARRAAVSRAKARASDAAMLVTRQAIQLHGGIGYTDEYDVGLYLRKVMVLANSFGSAAAHRTRFATDSPETEDT